MKKSKVKGIRFLVTLLIILAIISPAVFAIEVPDLNKAGSISITMRNGDEIIPGGSLILYRIAEVREDDGDYSFVFTTEMKDSLLYLEDIHSDQLAKDLSDYVKSAGITGIKKSIDTNGNVIFSNLQLGLYLLVQEEAAPDYYAANPFLVSVPMESESKWIYDIDATPKVELEQESEKETSSSDSYTEEVLPQTGQLNWPIPFLAATGLLLFAFGWFLSFAKRKNGNEE